MILNLCFGFYIPVVMYFNYVGYIIWLQIRKLDDSEFRNAFSRAYVRVCRLEYVDKMLYIVLNSIFKINFFYLLLKVCVTVHTGQGV